MVNFVEDHCCEKVSSLILFHLLKFRDRDKTSHGCLNGCFEIYYMKFVLTIQCIMIIKGLDKMLIIKKIFQGIGNMMMMV